MRTGRTVEALRRTGRGLVADPRYGRLPALLLVLTVVTGVVDAVSILALGRVFVANMTGNIVFVGFAVAGAPGFSLAASLIAVAGFLAGAGLGGPMSRRFGADGYRLLGYGPAVELVLVAAGLIVALSVSRSLPAGAKDAIAGLLAVAMGLQNSVARKLAVPDLTTTVLTMALTGVAADLRAGAGPALTRRMLSVVLMFAGAVVGAVLVLHARVVVALAVAVGLLLVVAAAAFATDRRHHISTEAVAGAPSLAATRS